MKLHAKHLFGIKANLTNFKTFFAVKTYESEHVMNGSLMCSECWDRYRHISRNNTTRRELAKLMQLPLIRTMYEYNMLFMTMKIAH